MKKNRTEDQALTGELLRRWIEDDERVLYELSELLVPLRVRPFNLMSLREAVDEVKMDKSFQVYLEEQSKQEQIDEQNLRKVAKDLKEMFQEQWFNDYLDRKLEVTILQWDEGDADEDDHLGILVHFLESVKSDLEAMAQNNYDVQGYLEVVNWLLNVDHKI